MPKGENPNSRRALSENRAKTQFSGNKSVIAAQKSAEKRRSRHVLPSDK